MVVRCDVRRVREVKRLVAWLDKLGVTHAIERECSLVMACKDRALWLAFLQRMKKTARFSYSC